MTEPEEWCYHCGSIQPSAHDFTCPVVQNDLVSDPVSVMRPESMMRSVEFDIGPDEGMTYICGKPPGHEDDAEIDRAIWQSRVEGWKERAELAEAERDEAKRVIRNAHQAIRTQVTAAAVALAMFDTGDAGTPSLLDELTQARIELERMRRVVKAVSAWRIAQNNMFTDVDWSGRVHNDLVAAVDAFCIDGEKGS